MRLATLFLLPGLLAAQIAAPNPGFVRFAGLPVETVLGVPGNLLLAKSPFAGARAVAFSDRCGLIADDVAIRLVKTDGTVLGEAVYRGAAPVLSIENTPETAVAWLSSESAILHWHDGAFARANVGGIEGAITSIALLTTQTARILATNADGSVFATDISLPGGNIVNATVLAGVRGPAFSFGKRLIYANEEGLEIEMAGNAHTQTLAGPKGAFHAERMSSEWVHLHFPAQNMHYALHLSAEPVLSMLPVPKVTK